VATGKRVYRSPLRAEQAQRTRAGVLDAAGRCFVARGYAVTTMRDIAEAAGVSVQTVVGQGGKAALLLACVDRAVVGDDESAPMLQREPVVAMLTARDKGEKLRCLRAIAEITVPRTGPLLRTFAAAAAVPRDRHRLGRVRAPPASGLLRGHRVVRPVASRGPGRRPRRRRLLDGVRRFHRERARRGVRLESRGVLRLACRRVRPAPAPLSTLPWSPPCRSPPVQGQRRPPVRREPALRCNAWATRTHLSAARDHERSRGPSR
jgi:AcrR family transcriptional regulator